MHSTHSDSVPLNARHSITVDSYAALNGGKFTIVNAKKDLLENSPDFPWVFPIPLSLSLSLSLSLILTSSDYGSIARGHIKIFRRDCDWISIDWEEDRGIAISLGEGEIYRGRPKTSPFRSNSRGGKWALFSGWNLFFFLRILGTCQGRIERTPRNIDSMCMENGRRHNGVNFAIYPFSVTAIWYV